MHTATTAVPGRDYCSGHLTASTLAPSPSVLIAARASCFNPSQPWALLCSHPCHGSLSLREKAQVLPMASQALQDQVPVTSLTSPPATDPLFTMLGHTIFLLFLTPSKLPPQGLCTCSLLLLSVILSQMSGQSWPIWIVKKQGPFDSYVCYLETEKE